MTSVRTETLFELPAYNGGPFVVFTAPAGVQTVITTMGISIGESVEPLGLILLADGLVLWGTGWFQDALKPVLMRTDVWLGRYVLAPTETLSVSTNGATTADFYAAGFSLTLP